MSERTLTLSALLGEDVRLERVLALHFASASQLETLLGTRLGFGFGHGLWLIIDCLVLTPHELCIRRRQPSTTGVKLFSSRWSGFFVAGSFVFLGLVGWLISAGGFSCGLSYYCRFGSQVQEHSLAFKFGKLLYFS